MTDISPFRLRSFITNVDSTGGPEACWPWRGSLNDDGYGHFGKRAQMAHRVAYELMRQPIPDGLVIDHVCHDDSNCAGGKSCLHRRCVNPEHLLAVRQRDNILRSGRTMPNRNAAKTHCPRGHEYSAENTRHTISTKTGGPRRECRTCIRSRPRQSLAASL